MKRYNLVRYSIPGADMLESEDGEYVLFADAQAEIDDLKQQLATACILASTSAESAHHFAVALIDARGAAVGYWSNKPVEEAARSWIDAQKPGVET